MVLDMSKVKLITQEGYGTERNPMILGSGKVLTLDTRLGKNEHIRGVVIYDFDVDDDGSRRASDDIMPVVPYEFINNLVARLLKIVDASYPDGEQRKAVRDLIMAEAWNWYHGLTDGDLVEAWRKDKFPNYAKAFDVVDEAREVK
jgi:hypothetical protein